MTSRSATLVPFALFLIILPFPGTVAARLLLLAICFGIALWQWKRVAAVRAEIPCRPVLAAWAAVCIASLSYAADVVYTAGELKNELGYTMMAFFSFFVIGRDKDSVLWLARALVVGLAILSTWAILGWISHGFVWNEVGGHGGIAAVATYVATILPMLVWLGLSDPTNGGRRMAMAAVVLAAFTGVITLQRAIWPVLAIELVIMFALIANRDSGPGGKRRLFAVAVMALGVGLAGMYVSQQNRFGGSVAPGVEMTTDTRLSFWPTVLANVAEHPVSGAGFGRAAMYKAYPELVPGYNRQLWHAHNVILNYGTGMGIPGVIAVVALFGCWGVYFLRAARRPAGLAGVVGFALIAGVLVRNQFNDMFVRDMSLMFWSLVGLLARMTLPSSKDESS